MVVKFSKTTNQKVIILLTDKAEAQPYKERIFMRHDFEQRREKRITNAKNRAIKNEQEAESLYSSAKEMASVIGSVN